MHQTLHQELITPSRPQVTQKDIFILDYMHDLISETLILCLNEMGDVDSVVISPLFYISLLKIMDNNFIDYLCAAISRDQDEAQRIFAFFFQEHIVTFHQTLHRLISNKLEPSLNDAREMVVHCAVVIQSLFWTEDKLVHQPQHPVNRYTYINRATKQRVVGGYLAYLFSGDILDFVSCFVKKEVNTAEVFDGFERAASSLSLSYVNKLYYHILLHPLDNDVLTPLLFTTSGERFLKNTIKATLQQLLGDKSDEKLIQQSIEQILSPFKKLDCIIEEKESVRENKASSCYATLFSQKLGQLEEKKQQSLKFDDSYSTASDRPNSR